MRALLQRVSKAKVTVGGKTVGEISQGFVILLGVTHSDSDQEADWLANKIAGLRVFEDSEGKMNLSLADVAGSVLVVSQFTLYGDSRKGRRPSFTKAARPEQAEPIVNYFAEQLCNLGFRVETGEFGSMMQVEIHNDGPVTLMLEKTNDS
jgi:D-tyrosyl-tRNA(Tyr) deacylase